MSLDHESTAFCYAEQLGGVFVASYPYYVKAHSLPAGRFTFSTQGNQDIYFLLGLYYRLRRQHTGGRFLSLTPGDPYIYALISRHCLIRIPKTKGPKCLQNCSERCLLYYASHYCELCSNRSHFSTYVANRFGFITCSYTFKYDSFHTVKSILCPNWHVPPFTNFWWYTWSSRPVVHRKKWLVYVSLLIRGIL